MDRTIYTLCEQLKFDKLSTRTSIYLTKQKYQISDENVKDILMETYIKYMSWNIDEEKNNRNLFTMIFKNKVIDYCKSFKKNNIISFSDIDTTKKNSCSSSYKNDFKYNKSSIDYIECVEDINEIDIHNINLDEYNFDDKTKKSIEEEIKKLK